MGKAGGGWRALAVVLALVLAFGVAVMLVIPLNPDDTPRCEQIASGECYEITETQQLVQNVVSLAGAAVGAIAVLLALAFAATGRRGGLLVRMTVAAVVLAGLVFLIGRL